MSYDLIVRNGFVIDGSGAPGIAADIAVRDGVIAEIGRVDGTATTEIDAAGRVVCPGFVDIHTHYDAQICWDPILTPSAEHGVTTVVVGNCGIGVAPSLPEHREINALDLVSLEGMSIDVLAAGVTWEWESFESYMGYAEACEPGINISFLMPLAALRPLCHGGCRHRARRNRLRNQPDRSLARIRHAGRGERVQHNHSCAPEGLAGTTAGLHAGQPG